MVLIRKNENNPEVRRKERQGARPSPSSYLRTLLRDVMDDAPREDAVSALEAFCRVFGVEKKNAFFPSLEAFHQHSYQYNDPPYAYSRAYAERRQLSKKETVYTLYREDTPRMIRPRVCFLDRFGKADSLPLRWCVDSFKPGEYSKRLGRYEEVKISRVKYVIVPRISYGVMYTHLMQGRVKTPLRFWVHLAAGARTNWVVIDIDRKHYSNRDILTEYRRIRATLGVPEFAVTSRSGKGIHLWYALENAMLVEEIKGRVEETLRGNGLHVAPGYIEVLPSGERAVFTPIPFGMNSYSVKNDGKVLRIPAMKAILRWHRSYLKRDEKIRFLDLSRLEPLRKRKTSSPRKQEEDTLPAPISVAVGTGGANETPMEIRRNLDRLFHFDFKGLTRRDVMRPLKHYTLVIRKMPVDKAGEWAWNWMWEHFRDHSDDMRERPQWARADLYAYFEKPISKKKNLNPPVISPQDFQLILRHFTKHFSDIAAYHERLVDVRKRGDRKNSIPDRPEAFRKTILRFMVYSFAYARSNPIRKNPLTARIALHTMRNWKGFSRTQHQKAIACLSRITKFFSVKSFSMLEAMEKGARNTFTFRIQPQGEGTPLDEQLFLRYCHRFGTPVVLEGIFGKAGLRKMRRQMRSAS